MGGSQSQESVATSTAVVPPPNRSGLVRDIVHNETSERTPPSSVPDLDISPLFLSTPHRSEPVPPMVRAEQETRREEEEDEEEEEEEEASTLMTFHTFLSRSLRTSEETRTLPQSSHQESEERRHQSRSNGHHHENLSSSSSHRNHHRHHRHHRQHDGSSGERRSHRSERSRRRYVAEELDADPFGLDLGISWSTLQQRLQAIQGGEESRSGGRHQSRSHRSRGSGSLLLFRPPDRMIKCPYCKKEIASSELDRHVSVCKTKPRIKYNEDKVLQDSGECSICLDDMFKGDSIARLPCLCIYHLRCLKKWYEKSQTCPVHPEFNST